METNLTVGVVPVCELLWTNVLSALLGNFGYTWLTLHI